MITQIFKERKPELVVVVISLLVFLYGAVIAINQMLSNGPSDPWRFVWHEASASIAIIALSLGIVLVIGMRSLHRLFWAGGIVTLIYEISVFTIWSGFPDLLFFSGLLFGGLYMGGEMIYGLYLVALLVLVFLPLTLLFLGLWIRRRIYTIFSLVIFALYFAVLAVSFFNIVN